MFGLFQSRDPEQAARDFYQEWSMKKSEKKRSFDFCWPDDPVKFADSTRITYESDKWNEDGEIVRYVHAFKSPNTDIIVQRPQKPTDAEEKRLVKLPTFTSCPEHPDNEFFTILGKCLHLEFRDPLNPKNLCYRKFSPKSLPLLVAQKNRENVLILVWPKGHAWIVTSPTIRISRRGILG